MVVGGLVMAFLSACTGSSPTQPPALSPAASRPATPRVILSPVIRRGVCSTVMHVPRTRLPSSLGLDPTQVVAQWLPGMNQRPCRIVTRRYSAAVARRLAKGINQSRKLPRFLSCPFNDGSAVLLTFAYHEDANLLVRVGLRGCNPASGLAGPQRRASQGVLRTLVPAAPQPWRRGLRRWIHY